VNFEYDENKSIKNKEKHKIDFEEAKSLWNNENALLLFLQLEMKTTEL
jgi:uncharacterized DUF497 family protein